MEYAFFGFAIPALAVIITVVIVISGQLAKIVKLLDEIKEEIGKK